MNATTKKLLEEALHLPDADRGDLAASLIDSLDPEIDQDTPSAWDSEILRRLTELDRGSVKPVPWPEARRMILDAADGSTGS